LLTKIFGKKSDKNSAEEKKTKALKERINKMNLSELTLYVKGKFDALEVNEEGLVEVLKRLLSKRDKEHYFLDERDDDSKLKKAFELVMLCARNKGVTFKAMELIAQFAKQYAGLIKAYDRKHKEIYEERLKKSVEKANEIIEAKIALRDKMNLLD